MDLSVLWHDIGLPIPTSIGSSFTGVAGEIVRIGGRVMLDLDGDGRQDATIMIAESLQLSIEDFVFSDVH